MTVEIDKIEDIITGSPWEIARALEKKKPEKDNIMTLGCGIKLDPEKRQVLECAVLIIKPYYK